MATESSFYLEQAENCARQAESSSLANQRDTHLRSQAAWQALADRKLLTEAKRARLDAQKQLAEIETADGQAIAGNHETGTVGAVTAEGERS